MNKVAIVLAVAFGLTSCLDKMPADAIPEGQGMKTFSDAEQTLTGIYNAYMSGALYSGYLTLLPYGALYTVIARCNFYLDQVDELRAGLTDDERITYLDYYTGEVYCARANAYAELLKCFCEAYDPSTAHQQQGVAIDSTYFGAKPQGRSSLKESYEFVIKDLKKAEELLDEENDYYTNPYVTKAAANALHARVALYMQD